MNFLYLIFFIFFLIPNILILKSDIQEKKIPNKYLIWILLLFPFFFLIDFFYFHSFTTLFFFHIFISLILSFILYYFWVWSAWDAKYLLILSLFLPKTWIIPFIGNIAIITLLYLFTYFIYFYLKLFFHSTYRKSFLGNFVKESKDKAIVIIENLKNPHTHKIHIKENLIRIIKQILFFLLFFIFIRLLRIDIIEWLKNTWFLKENIQSLWSYIIFWGIFLSFIILFIYKSIFKKIKYLIKKIFKDHFRKILSTEKIIFINLVITISSLIALILFDYYKSWNEVFHKLGIILSLYLFLFLLFKILLASYKLTFQMGEQTFIPIKELKAGEIFDKLYVINIFWTQKCLWNKQEEWILSPDPWLAIKKIENPLNKEGVELLKNIYETTSNYHKKNKTPNFSEIKDIKILKTFAFSPYIFWGFLLSFFFWDVISLFMEKFWQTIIEKLIH